MRHEGILAVVSGFSGAGKGTLMKRLMETYDQYALSISMTTRAPRGQERDGVDYFFTDRASFEKAIENGGLIEYACYCDNYYGTPKAYVEEKRKEGKDVILEIELQGALKIKEKFPDALLVFITPPSADELLRRLQARGTETEEVIRKRLRRAVEEAADIEKYDAVLVNDDLETCARELHGLIQAAHCRMSGNLDMVAQIREELVKLVEGDK